jgi:hypothetical protein
MNNHNGWWIPISQKNSSKKFIVPHVTFWWIDEKWHQHDIMVVVIGEVHNNWKGIVVIKLQKIALEWDCIYNELQLMQLV